MIILNAGIGAIHPFSEVKDTQYHRQVMETNFWGAVNCTMYALPHIEKSKGTIAVISSLSGKFPVPNRTAYCASKHAVHGFFGALRLEMRSKGVKVCMLCPGYVYTEFQQHSLGAEQGVERNKSKFITPEQCAKQVIDGIEDEKAELLMTLTGKVASVLMPIVPSHIVDGYIAKTAHAASQYASQQQQH